jgi:rubrerythrin
VRTSGSEEASLVTRAQERKGRRPMERGQLEELLYQSLETERGGVQVYEAAVRCARNDELKQEWSEYLAQTRNHERVMLRVLDAFGLDAETPTPGREILRGKAKTMVGSMEMAMKEDPSGAQLVAAECVVEAETKDHMNWQLIGEAAKKLSGDEARTLTEAHDEVEDEEDEHLFHTMGWARELWLDSLGLPAVIPPPEEKKDVKSAIGAERARQSREKMLRSGS